MCYRYEHKKNATEFVVTLSFKDNNLKLDIDKIYLEEDGKIFVQPAYS